MPVIDIYDVNLDEGEATVALDELTGKKVEMPEVERQETDTHHLQLAMGDFGSGMDGIYRLSVHAVDLAGNDDEAELFFTVNRNGSYYAFDQKTEAMVQKVFISSPEKVVIYENNMDWLTDSSVILSCNGSQRGSTILKAQGGYKQDDIQVVKRSSVVSVSEKWRFGHSKVLVLLISCRKSLLSSLMTW